MSKTINLLPAHKRSILKNNRIANWLRFVAVCSLSLVFLLALGLFSYTAFSPLPSLQEEQQTLLLTLNQQQRKIVTLLHTKARLQEIAMIINKRAPLDNTLKMITDTAGADVIISSMELSKSEMKVNIQSRTLSALDTFIHDITAKEVLLEEYNIIVMEHMTFDNKSNMYTASLVFTLYE
jgi:hypothetical protein